MTKSSHENQNVQTSPETIKINFKGFQRHLSLVFFYWHTSKPLLTHYDQGGCFFSLGLQRNAI